jgi:aryl-alcohol dehydrogenase-like predicted oxidoreductase
MLTRLGNTLLDVSRLCLGGNVFGWTADSAASLEVLDAFVAAGGNFIDSSDSYSAWVTGNSGGESETLIGEWLARRNNRSSVVIATKVGRHPERLGLAPPNIRRAVADSLKRLQTDYIDLYYAHADDPDVPIAETLGAFAELIQEGTVRYIGASNYDADRLSLALTVSEREHLPRFVALQPRYNLLDRLPYEAALRDVCSREGLACVPYYGLARGFLTGKYRPGGPTVESPRAEAALDYMDERGVRVIDELTAIAADRNVTCAAVALAWLASRPTVAAPIASARTLQQLDEILPAADLALSGSECARLDDASALPSTVLGAAD